MICIQSKKTIMEVGSQGPIFKNANLGYIAWNFNTIITGNYYYFNSVDLTKTSFSVKDCVQLIDSPTPKISLDDWTMTIENSTQLCIKLNNLDAAALKLASNDKLSLYYSVGNLKSGSVSIDNLTIDLMDLFIPDLSLSGTESNSLYSCTMFEWYAKEIGGVLPSIVFIFGSDTLDSSIQFIPFFDDFPAYSMRMDARDYPPQFRVCLK